MRISMTLIVACHHLRMAYDGLPFGGGYLGVDFFLIISGYFSFKSLSSDKFNNVKAGARYVVSRYLRLWKEYIISFLIGMAVCFVLNTPLEGSLFRYIMEFFMLEGVNNSSQNRINPPGWYCGYYLLGIIILVVFLLLLPQISKKPLVFLVVSLILYAVLFCDSAHLCIYPAESGFSLLTLIRVMAGLLLGLGLASFRDSMDSNMTIKGKASILIISVILMCTVFSFTIAYNGFSRVDYIVLSVIILLCGCLAVLPELSWPIWINSAIKLLGSSAFTIYLNHYSVCRIFYHYNSVFYKYDWKIITLIYVLIVTLFGVLLHKGYDFISKRYLLGLRFIGNKRKNK